MQILDQATGYLIAFGAAAALWRQQREGGSWHVQVSLAQTGHWLRGLGRVPDGLRARQARPHAVLETSASGFGRLGPCATARSWRARRRAGRGPRCRPAAIHRHGPDDEKLAHEVPQLPPEPVAVVTGGARGIGLAIGRWFLAQRHRVALLDIDGATLRRSERTLNDAGARAGVATATCPIRRRSTRRWRAVEAASAASTRWSTTPASRSSSRSAETSFDEWRHVLATNLDGAFLCTQACAPLMLRRRRRRDRQHRLDLGPARQHAARGLRHQQGRADPPDQAAGGRTGQRRASASMPSRRGRSTPRWPSWCTAWRSAPTTTTRSRSIATARPKRSRRPPASCAARRPATSTARCWRWTAASTRPAWACRRCARPRAD